MAGDPARHRREAGLTLVELMVSLALLGLLFALLQDGFTLGQRVWERATTRVSARIDAVEATQGFLRDRIARANPAYTLAGNGQISFEGDARSLAFDAPAPDAMGQGTYLRYVLALTEAGDLEIAWKPDTDRSPVAPMARSVLLSGVAGLDIAYFGTGRGEGPAPPRWRDAWRGQAAPPALVRLRVRFPAGDGRVWPELVVAPRATLDATCTWDAGQRGCVGRS